MILNLIFLTEINFITIFNIYTIKSEPVKFKNISQISLKFGVESFNFSRFIVYICFGIIFLFPFIIFNRGTIYIYILWFFTNDFVIFNRCGVIFSIFWFVFTIHIYYFRAISLTRTVIYVICWLFIYSVCIRLFNFG